MRDPAEICYSCMGELPQAGAVCPRCGWDNARRDCGPGYLSSRVLNNQYFVGRALGRGGFGVTYLGLDLYLDRRVAIKEYFPSALALRTSDNVTIAPYADSEGRFRWGLQRALDEGITTAKLNHIQNVVQIYNVFQTNGTAYIVMEYIEGTTLAKKVADEGRMPWRDAIGLMRPVMEALEDIHAQNLIHRDISPENIMLRAGSAKPVLLDFGAARSYESAKQEMTEVIRPGYAPPEQYSSTTQQDARTDEYALCATMYFMLTGKIPPSSDMLACGAEKLKSPSELGAEIPAGAQQALLKGMSTNIEDRYPSIETLREALDAARDVGTRKSSWFIRLLAWLNLIEDLSGDEDIDEADDIEDADEEGDDAEDGEEDLEDEEEDEEDDDAKSNALESILGGVALLLFGILIGGIIVLYVL